jgi:hypothetical protein
MHSAAVIAYKQARTILTALRLGTGPFASLTRQQRDTAIERLLGVPTPAQRRQIEHADAAQKSERNTVPPSGNRTSPIAASHRRQWDNRPTNALADCGYRR